MGAVAAAAREHLVGERADLVRTVLDCADAVAAGWDGDATTDRDRVVPPLRGCLDRSGALDALPGALAGAVAAAGRELPAEPVAAPPYVPVTSRGPVLRATLAGGRPSEAARSRAEGRPSEANRSGAEGRRDGGDRPGADGRLVVTLRAFDVKRGCGGVRYVRGPDVAGEAVAVELRDARRR